MGVACIGTEALAGRVTATVADHFQRDTSDRTCGIPTGVPRDIGADPGATVVTLLITVTCLEEVTNPENSST